jgi:DNA-binding NarL/FixJ family response regulator
VFLAQLLTANPNSVADSGYGERRLGNPMGSSPKTGTSPTVIRVLSVDDHALIRDGVAALIANQKDVRLVGEASNGREAIEQFRSHRPDVTLMDLQMPEMNGIDALIAIRSEFPDARIIVLTTYAGDALCKRAMKAGAQAYILKGNVRKDLLDTIRAVRAGKKILHAEVAAELATHAADDALSQREIEVLSLIAAGNSNKLVADQLAISEDTVKGHVKSILSKLGVNDRTHAVTAALKRGIIEL